MNPNFSDLSEFLPMKCSEVANAALTFSPDFAMAPVAVSTHGRTHARTHGRTDGHFAKHFDRLIDLFH